jgi:hypothetical protein
MPNCKEVSRLVSRVQDERLPFGQRLLLRFHMLWCDGCRQFERQTAFLSRAMHRYRD